MFETNLNRFFFFKKTTSTRKKKTMKEDFKNEWIIYFQNSDKKKKFSEFIFLLQYFWYQNISLKSQYASRRLTTIRIWRYYCFSIIFDIRTIFKFLFFMVVSLHCILNQRISIVHKNIIYYPPKHNLTNNKIDFIIQLVIL